MSAVRSLHACRKALRSAAVTLSRCVANADSTSPGRLISALLMVAITLLVVGHALLENASKLMWECNRLRAEAIRYSRQVAAHRRVIARLRQEKAELEASNSRQASFERGTFYFVALTAIAAVTDTVINIVKLFAPLVLFLLILPHVNDGTIGHKLWLYLLLISISLILLHTARSSTSARRNGARSVLAPHWRQPLLSLAHQPATNWTGTSGA